MWLFRIPLKVKEYFEDFIEDVHDRFRGNEAPKDLNIAGEDLKDVAVQNLTDGERVPVECAIRNPKIKEA